MKILIIEDEKYIARPMAQILQKNNYSVELAHDGEMGLDFALTGIYDVIILDIMMPKMDGIQVCKRLRLAKIDTPVLMLTAKGQTREKIAGLDVGADDYMAKPFDYDELLARIRALTRRRGTLQESQHLKISNLIFEPQTMTLETKAGKVTLPLKEGQLLELLLLQGKMTTSKELIIDKLWNFDAEIGFSNVEYHISLLRKKLKLIEAKASIKTIRGVGYLLVGEDNG